MWCPSWAFWAHSILTNDIALLQLARPVHISQKIQVDKFFLTLTNVVISQILTLRILVLIENKLASSVDAIAISKNLKTLPTH